jgi:hypothetical protein
MKTYEGVEVQQQTSKYTRTLAVWYGHKLLAYLVYEIMLLKQGTEAAVF